MEIFILINTIIAAIVFAFGSSIGSFLNVVIYRIPEGLSLVYPPSRCPKCGHQLGKSENIPVFGWLRLRGRCSWCKSSISTRYPTIEAATGILFLLVFWQFGYSLHTLGYWAFLSWLLALSAIDFDTMTLPNSLTKSCLVLGLIFQGAIGWYDKGISGLIDCSITAIFSAVVAIWLLDGIRFFASVILQKEAMGAGDGKLMAGIGAWIGWKYMLLSGFIACFLGAFIGGGAMSLGLLKRHNPMPFGPFLAMGAALTIFWGETILSTYFKLFFPQV